ncbi:MAG: glycosyl hydrolase family 18 protein [Bacteroidia bacterium]
MKRYIAGFLLLFIWNGMISVYSQSDRFKVVGYISIRAAMDDENKIPFERLTHVNLWFLNPDSAGEFHLDIPALLPFVEKAHKKHTMVLFSIGGGSKQPQYHHLLQDANRAGLIKNLMQVVKDSGADGIDVDLEGSDIDENYEKFVGELATALHAQNKLLTAAVAVYYKEKMTDKVLGYYDFVNVMSYDRTGPWRPEKPGPHSTYDHAVEDLTYFGVERGIAPEKMTLGVPFYGYGFGNSPEIKPVSMSFSKIAEQYPGAVQADEWKMEDGKTLYYNGIPTMRRKTALAAEKASGIMIWQVMGDAPGKNSLLRAIHKSGKKYRK